MNTLRSHCKIPSAALCFTIVAGAFFGLHSSSADPTTASDSGMVLSELKTEFLREPLGLETAAPRFSWVMDSAGRGERQTAYRIRVASSLEGLQAGRADLWDSGQVDSDQSVGVPYQGGPLASGGRSFWQVQARDKDGAPSGWSEPAWFEMGLLQESDWGGQWIGAAGDGSIQLRKSFTLDQPVTRARAYLSGLGCNALHLNGRRIGDKVQTIQAYAAKSAYYSIHDVTADLVEGENVLGIVVTRGFHGRTLALFQLNIEFADGSSLSLVSDPSWKVTDSPVVDDFEQNGLTNETYDARLETPGWTSADFDDSGWGNAVVKSAPGGLLRAELMPPSRKISLIEPIARTNPAPGIYVFQFPRHITGWIELEIPGGERGDIITVKHQERINAEGFLDFSYGKMTEEKLSRIGFDGRPKWRHSDYYIKKGSDTEVWGDDYRFGYRAFVYVQIEGFPGTPELSHVRAREVHTDLESIGSFDCSHPLLNTIHRAARQTFLNNYHSFPMDCPWYERTGWGGDANCTAEMAFHNFDMIHTYRKWMQDYEDNMAANGNVYFIVPQGMPGRVALEAKHQNHSPWWMLPPVFIPYWQYEMTGDLALLEEFYPIMKRRMNHEVEVNLTDNLASSHWGDWLAPFAQLLPKARETQATAIVFYALKCMEEVAVLLGHRDDADAWSARAAEVAQAYHDKYYDAEKQAYWRPGESAYCQTSNLLPLAFGMVPDELLDGVRQSLGKNITRIQTGVVGAKFLLPVLTESGHLETAWRLATTTDYPSWGHWFTDASHALDTHTLLESWNPDPRSLAHPYFGSVDEWYYKFLAGITPAKPGFKEIQIKPHLPAGLDRAGAEIQTVHGTVKSHWQRKGDGLTLGVTIPANTTATIFVPTPDASKVRESGTPAAQSPGVTYLSSADGHARYQVGSGTYSFVVE